MSVPSLRTVILTYGKASRQHSGRIADVFPGVVQIDLYGSTEAGYIFVGDAFQDNLRAIDGNAPRFPIPWSFANAERAEQTFGRDFWPYGIEPNRATLESFLSYAHEQGVCAEHLAPEDLFPPQVSAEFRI